MLWIICTLSFALANEDGRTGKAEAGCAKCHGNSPASTSSAVFSMADSSVIAGETVAIEFVVSTTNNSHTAAGLNVSASGGAFRPGTTTIKSKKQIAHPEPLDMTDGQAVFTFDWTAPATNGAVTVYGAGNAVNDNGKKTGDGWTIAEPLTLTVEGGEPEDTNSPEDTAEPIGADDPGDGKANGTGCDTSQSPTHWFGWLAVLTILGVSRRQSLELETRRKAARLRIRKLRN